ncbi:MAG: hypothetical protein QOF67_3139 [Mycobacterium sp.]|jgi:hypothetical protein|nr:hypothetical protein [Mycobacterium sp.]
MTRIFAACLVAAGAVLVAAPQAAADPEDHVPYCSADQTPMDNNCRPMSGQEYPHGSGVDPDVPSGFNPGAVPVVGP